MDLTNKGTGNDFISIRNGDAFIDIESELVEMFNTHYLHCRKNIGCSTRKYVVDTNNTQETIEGIIRKYKRHPSIPKFKNFVSSIIFYFPKAEVADINAETDPKQTDTKKQLDLTLIPQN